MHVLQVCVYSLFLLGVMIVPGYCIYKKSGIHSYIGIILYLFGLIFICRLFVNVVELHPSYNLFENIMDSIIHSLQSFSMDEDYTAYLESGKRAFQSGSIIAEVYAVIVSVLNTCAPIFGGAVILQIITGIFPKIRVVLCPYRSKFVFSELNEATITFAENIVQDNYYRTICPESRLLFNRKPLIIFTDAYPDNKSEKRTELFNRAIAINAICIKTDLKHLSVKRSKWVFYFLMDNDEQQNIESLNNLINEPGCSILWPKGHYKKNGGRNNTRTKIYVFAQSDYSMAMINNVIERKKEAGEQILIRPIRDYTTMTLNLMHNIPLFTPLVSDVEQICKDINNAISQGKSTVIPKRDLHVTLVGSGAISEECFKTIIWCGQMAGIQLNIHVVSKNAKQMLHKLKNNCPELFESCKENSDLLNIYPFKADRVYSSPYAICDQWIVDIDPEYVEEYPELLLSRTDYYIIALGSDEKNVYLTTRLNTKLSRGMLESGEAKRPVIVPIVFDDQLAEAIKVSTPSEYTPYILPTGMLKERFSCKNVFMSDFIELSEKTGDLYSQQQSKQRDKDEYQYWSNIARTVHAPYKLFALGCIKEIDFNRPVETRCILQKSIINEDNPDNNLDRIQSWMEHRRWNAYLRSQGFVHSSVRQQLRSASTQKDLKSNQLRLHSCLVERSLCPMQLYDNQTKLSIENIDNLDLASLKEVIIEHIIEQEEKGIKDESLILDNRISQQDLRDIIQKYNITTEVIDKLDYKRWDALESDPALKCVLDSIEKGGYINKKQVIV